MAPLGSARSPAIGARLSSLHPEIVGSRGPTLGPRGSPMPPRMSHAASPVVLPQHSRPTAGRQV
eukprot:730938-Pyramimonas_sp.AAC.1